MKLFFKLFLIWLVSSLIQPTLLFAADANYVTLVFPVRARNLWRQGSQLDHFTNLYRILADSQLPSTWLLHYDELSDEPVVSQLKQNPHAEIGIFLEITQKLAQDSQVIYDWEHDNWSAAYKVFPSGYSVADRLKMIDHVFSKFKDTFGFYPVAYGAWYIDVKTIEYIKQKYSSDNVLGLADQYSTDGYQTWGQYLNAPYFVSKSSAIEPAFDDSDSTGVLKVQWAPRDPVRSFGLDFNHSNYSLQANDYRRSLHLDQKYFDNLLSTLTVNAQGKVSHVVVGIEVGELQLENLFWIGDQLKTISDFQQAGKIQVISLAALSKIYHMQFSATTTPILYDTSDGLTRRIWYSTSRYRIGFRSDADGVFIDDLRYFHLSDYRDNDQTSIDTHKNLVRVVPARIDALVLKNPLKIGDPGRLILASDNGNLVITTSSNQIKLTPQLIISNTHNISDIFIPPTPKAVDYHNCGTEFGRYSGRFNCLKLFIVNIFSKLPVLAWSKLEDQYYFGLVSNNETLLGLRIPKLKIAKFNFPYSTLAFFQSTKRILSPHYTWLGKQEFELPPVTLTNKIIEKGAAYGNDELLKNTQSQILFENGYYSVISAHD